MEKPDAKLMLKILIGLIVAIITYYLAGTKVPDETIKLLIALLLGVLAFIYLP